MSIKVIEGDFAASKGKYALIVSRWNSFVVESLKEGALDTLRRHGIKDENVTIYYAPGAFEFPVVAQKIAAKKEFDAIIALGAVIRGGTPHFDYVAGECTKGLAQVSLNAGVPITFGVLTVVQSFRPGSTRSGLNARKKSAPTLSPVLSKAESRISLVVPG